MFDELWDIDPRDQSGLVRGIAELERLKAAAAAGQARLTAALDAARRSAEEAAGVPIRKRGRGLASEVALARSDSPARGGQHLGFAKALVYEMPHTLAALERGVLSEWRATIVVRESACLDVEDRRRLDSELCSDPDALLGVGDAALGAKAKAIAYRLDPHAVVDRAAKADAERTVTIRPAPDTMTYVTALLPVAQGVSVYAALKREADASCDARSRGQVMADTLVERVTGRPADQPVPVAVNLVVSDQMLLGAEQGAAVIAGYGSVPSAVAQQMVMDAVTDERSRATLRRLYANPDSGALVAMDSRSRLFPKGLADFIEMRDQRCRTPYCDAPIRHRDHAIPHSRGGATSAENGQGLCEACNYAKESPGWQVNAAIGENGVHTAEFITPTGAHYHSAAPPMPGTPKIPRSSAEVYLNGRLLQVIAA
ncbi:HNH endonuclease [Mycolicibacterium aichiense]|uniref:HNH endonuclease n=1 Tax=Mycolicibacterium aichiense TaxID=1799 RepID=A0AAD1HN58_9MYCO|nr:HNH endonuclease signature motif containing protein [Mycolicibacterium aichiense]MCV7018896.1 HNH endonuclease [Mycolicibacterium aichiense]BBX08563.1 HNH endonuclease [Mycolicibacterium aichiense]STZ82359.1 HNH endonuclease [Mycolicibacterium aichiense]